MHIFSFPASSCFTRLFLLLFIWFVSFPSIKPYYSADCCEHKTYNRRYHAFHQFLKKELWWLYSISKLCFRHQQYGDFCKSNSPSPRYKWPHVIPNNGCSNDSWNKETAPPIAIDAPIPYAKLINICIEKEKASQSLITVHLAKIIRNEHRLHVIYNSSLTA